MKTNKQKAQKDFLDNRKAKNLCLDCGRKLDNIEYALCEKCRAKHSISASKSKDKRRKLWKEQGLCMECGKERNNNTQLCNSCKAKNNEYNKNNPRTVKALMQNKETTKILRKKRIEKEQCPYCGKPRFGNVIMCKKHFLMDRSRIAMKSQKYWKDIEEIFNRQEGRCYYTGIKIELGVNASIDHKIPRCCNKPEVYTLKNLVWCYLDINVMKNKFEHDEFIDICRIISNNFKPVEK